MALRERNLDDGLGLDAQEKERRRDADTEFLGENVPPGAARPSRNPAAAGAAAGPQPSFSSADGLNQNQLRDLLRNCLKLASENKISERNTWELKLIDHMREIVGGDALQDAAETNFQEAGCALETGARIYSTRVDSVHKQTFQLIGTVHRTAVTQDAEQESQEFPDTQDNDEDDSQNRAKDAKKAYNAQSTIETVESLNVKKLEVAFNADPLFQQTSAQFDEGGARGLLLNMLGVNQCCKIVFDSDEVPDVVGEPELLRTSDQELDGTFLQDKIDNLLHIMDVEHEISPTLAVISGLLNDPRREAAAGQPGVDATQDSHGAPPSPAQSGAGPMDGDCGEDPTAAGEDLGDFSDNDGGGSWGDGGHGLDDDTASRQDPSGGCGTAFHSISKDWEVDPQNGEASQDGDQETTSFSKDALHWLKEGLPGHLGSSNAWAGPDYWRYRRPRAKENQAEEKPSSATAKAPRRKRGPFTLNFKEIGQMQRDNSKFRAGTTKATCLPKRNTTDTFCLPEDHHYSSVNLVQFFDRRPDMSVLDVPLRRAMMTSKNADAGMRHSGGPGEAWDDDHGDDPEAQEDESGFGTACDEWGESTELRSCQDNDDLVAQPRQVEKVEITYDKRPVQVDVKALKQILWSSLTSSANSANEEPQSFKRLLEGFPQTCVAGRLEDVSVHLCFICVLHLANEHNLAIKGVDTLDELRILQVPAIP